MIGPHSLSDAQVDARAIGVEDNLIHVSLAAEAAALKSTCEDQYLGGRRRRACHNEGTDDACDDTDPHLWRRYSGPGRG